MNQKMMTVAVIAVLAITGVTLAVFFNKNKGNDNGGKKGETMGTYASIGQEEAMKLMESEKDYIILDVRTPEEFAEGRIKGAINVPNETIGSGEVKELPNKDQLIFVYCRSGNRSRQAAEKLYKQGYTNLKEMGGIMTWKGEIER